jgi:hypothetical protein
MNLLIFNNGYYYDYEKNYFSQVIEEFGNKLISDNPEIIRSKDTNKMKELLNNHINQEYSDLDMSLFDSFRYTSNLFENISIDNAIRSGIYYIYNDDGNNIFFEIMFNKNFNFK